jgi:IS5 family transposase
VDGFRRCKGSKVHALVAPPGLPSAVAVGPANSHDATAFPQLMAGLRLGSWRGRPRTGPEELCADGAYDTREIRHHLRRQGIRASIPENPRGRRRPRRGRAYRLCPAHLPGGQGDGGAFLAWLKGGFRRLALRYERRLATFAALVHLACFMIAWRVLR